MNALLGVVHGRFTNVQFNETNMNNSEANIRLQRVTYNWAQRNITEALNDVSTLIAKGSPETKLSARLLSGMIKADMGDFNGARHDWLPALRLSAEGSFTKYLLQHNIGEAYEKEGRLNDATVWYRKALRTCAAGDEFSADRTLLMLKSLNKGKILEKDRAIVATAIDKSWRVLQLPGLPDPDNLSKAITQLTQGLGKIVKKIKDAD